MKTHTPIPRNSIPLRLNSKALLALAIPLGWAAQASTDYGPAYYREVYPGHWNTSGYGKKFYVIHDIEGYYWSCISYFQRSTTYASVHYTINGKKDNGSDANPGEVTQMVRDAYYAWHAKCWNSHSMGTEHEGFASNPAWYTAEMYQSSADLTRAKANKYGFPKTRNYIVAHGEEAYTPSWPGWASANLGIDGYCQTHHDPGPYWDWSGFMNKINNSAPPPPPVTNPPYVFDADSQGWAAGNGLSAIAYNNSGWPGIIYNDQVGNDAFNYGPACSFGGGGDPSINVSVYPQSGTTPNHDMQVFWKTAEDNTWSAGKSSPIVTYSAQNAWATINLDVNANWPTYYNKTINQFRLDFDNGNSGTRWILNHFLVQTTPRFWFSAGSTDGWTAANGLSATWSTDCCGWPGVLVTDQTGNDAFITRDITSLNYRGGQNDRVLVRVYPQGGSKINHDIKLYWATQLENYYSEAKSSPMIYYSGKDQWFDIWFDVGANGYWMNNGPITWLRLDFDANNSGVRWLVDQVQVVHNGSATFAAYNNGNVVSITAPATVNAGATFSATVVMNNSGTKAWTGNHKIGSQSPQDNNRWGLTRVAVTGTINPGANATFTFNSTAPTTPGAYAFDWKMLEEGVQWFGPIAQATINVINPGPAAPSGVAATAPSYSQVNVSWVDNSSNETGFKVQRGSSSGGPFSDIATVGANTTSYSNTGLSAGTAYYYRVLSTNSGGDSTPSNVAGVTTPNQPPDLAAVGNKTGTEASLLTFTASASNPNQLITTTTWATWEGNNHNDAEIVFRKPINSASTSSFIDTAVTNYTLVSSTFPSGGGGARVSKSSWSFKTGTTNPWLRLTTAGAPGLPNPIISQDQVLRFRINSTKALKVGLGVRETGSTGAYGANGGITGTLEWAAVTNVVSGAPIPSKSIAANTWTTVDINIPFEAQAAFTGDGVISSGKGVLEHLALRAEGGTGVYDVYLDDIAVVEPNTLTYSLDAGAPSGASIQPKTGVFKWTPSSGQAGTHNITVRVTDRLGLQDFETISVTIVASGNHKPVLAAIGNKTANENTALQFTAGATDQDAGQTLTFSLDAGNPAGSSITTGGAFSWTPTEAQGPGSYPITVRVTDNGSPATNAFETITVTVNEVNVAPVLGTIADQTINEGDTLAATATATDADVPVNTITYSLDAGAPVGLTIHSGNGAISWPTAEAQGPAIYPVTVRATDAGGLSDAKTFNVTVNEVNTAPVLSVNTTITSVEPVFNFDSVLNTSYSGTVLFRQPLFSSSTSVYLDTAATNYTAVTTTYPGSDGLNKVLQANWSFKTGTTNPWLRFTTYNTATQPNPTVNFAQRVRFKIYSDKNVGVALGLRETDTAAVIGQNGGTTGTMEWSGATANAGSPVPTRTVTAGAWTTLEFIIPNETTAAYTGNGTLTSTTGKGVLEHLALTPAGGLGVYNVYVDDFEVVTVTTNLTVNTGQTVTFTSSTTDADFPAQTITYSLDAGAPSGAVINSATGAFSWTPAPAQGPSTNVITVRATDDGPGALSHTRNVTIIVNKVNTAPSINAFPDQGVEINGGTQINITVGATDADGDTLTFSLQGSVPAGAAIVPSTGVFTWTPPNTLSNYAITVRATDNGVPNLYDEKDMLVSVSPTNATPILSLSTARITEKVVNFESIANSASDVLMFRKPLNSASSSMFIDTAVTNYTHLATSGIPSGNPNAGAKALKAGWTFKTGTTNAWLRLTTYNPTLIPNVTIDLGARLKFDIHCDKSIKVGLGIRESGTSAAIGANGGTTGAIEWIGATKSGTTPAPSRVVNANTWTTLEFNLPAEYCTNYSSGNSVLATGKGVLEHLIIVPNSGLGAYIVYLDNFEVVSTPALPSSISMNANATLTYTASASDPDPGSGLNFGLDADTPAGSAIDLVTGAFSWTPASAGSYNIVTYVNDNPTNGAPQKTASHSFAVTVTADPLAVQTGSFVAGGDTVNLTWDSVPGRTYAIQVKEGPDGEWSDYQQVTATGAISAVQVANGGGDSVFRVVEVGGSSAE